MEVRIGWNTQYGAAKFDVTVTEFDLIRILQENEFDSSVTPASLTTSEAFKLLEGEAKRFSIFASVEYAVVPKEQAVPQLEAVAGLQKARIDALKARLSAG